jgi:L-fucose isomerase-like protein
MHRFAISTKALEDSMPLTYGVAVLARPTFDVPFAEDMKDKAFAALDAAGIRTVGPRALLFDADAAAKAVDEIKAAGDIDLLLILQITFTDATMTVKLAKEATTPLAIWAVPEPRLGGRLRLNAYCGLNLAAHALGRAGVAHGWLYADPADVTAEQLRTLAVTYAAKPSAAAPMASTPNAEADRVLAALNGARFTVVGQHPAGFDTCEYDPDLLQRLGGFEVGHVELPELFDQAKAIAPERVAAARAMEAAQVNGLDEVNQEQLDRSFRVFCALQDVKAQTGAKGLAVRCWPEMFTEYGCAACGPMAMMNQERVPSACEADVNGSLTQLILQELAGEPAWMADLVDITPADDTAVIWHCGLAPLSMLDPQAKAEAQIHTNRKMPLLHQFPIKPGRITLARVSRARNQVKLMIAGAEVVRRPMAFTGNSGTIRFDRPAADVASTIMDEGLEHHFALAYGDHRPALRAIAARWNLPVLELA